MHTKLHVGAAATINLVYILLGLWLVWKPKYDFKETMKWVASGLAIWNIVAIAFFLSVLPFSMELGDTLISNGQSTQQGQEMNMELGLKLRYSN